MTTSRPTESYSPSRVSAPHVISDCRRPPPWKKILLGTGLIVLLASATAAGIFIHFYLQFAQIIDARLNGSVFGNPAVILAAPSALQVGQPLTVREVMIHLRNAGYLEGREGPSIGSYTATDRGL